MRVFGVDGFFVHLSYHTTHTTTGDLCVCPYALEQELRAATERDEESTDSAPSGPRGEALASVSCLTKSLRSGLPFCFTGAAGKSDPSG